MTPVFDIDKDYYTSDVRATVVAENQTNALYNDRLYQQAVQSGKKYKTWITKLDQKVRDTHKEIHGEIVAIDMPFIVGDSELMYPCDLSGSYKEICNCRCVVAYKDNKDTEDSLKEPDDNDIISGARKVDVDSSGNREIARKLYDLIRNQTNDIQRISDNTGYSKEDIEKIKNYLFLDKNKFNAITGEWELFDPDYPIAQSWQRLKNGDIKDHDLTLIKHELEEMRIKESNPSISHLDAHNMANQKFNYEKEVDVYYGNTR